MKENKNPSPTTTLDKEPGKPGFKPGHTAVPGKDEDVVAEKENEKTPLKQDTNDETKKIVNEQEQEQVVNDDEAATETNGPAKMKAD